LGFIYQGLSDYTQALEYFKKSFFLAEEIGNIEEVSIVLKNMGDVCFMLKNYNKALSYYQKAIARIESVRGDIKNEQFKTGFLEKYSDTYSNTIQCLYELHQQQPAKEFDRMAFTYIEKSKARGLLDLLAESEVDIRQGIDPELLKQEQALEEEYAQANTHLQHILSGPETSIDQQLVSALRKDLESIDDQLEDMKFKITRENPRYAEIKYPEPVTITQIQDHLLKEHTLLIEYKVTGDALFACGISSNGFHFIKLDITKEELTEKVLALRNCFEVIEDEGLIAGRAFELYDVLLRPVLNNFDRKEELLIVPDGILNYLPFETLIPEEAYTAQGFSAVSFLINDYTIRYVQSATVAYNLAKKTSGLTGDRLFAMGDPVFSQNELMTGNGYIRSALSDEERDRLKRLIYSGEEVKSISGLFSESSVYLRKEATEERLKISPLENYRYLHLATHGLLNENNPRFSGLVLTLDDDPTEDGFLLTREIFNLTLNADLVVLSACRTGLGKLVDGEGIVGLTRAWFYAGASSLVVSLWNINDRSTSLLMEAFYKKIQEGLDYGRALREAKLTLIGQEVYSHPYYWGGFILMGGNHEQ
jgi:CHAT domain-containing protein